MNKISRFVFNFRSRCNMHCPYCYIPFVDPKPGNLPLWQAIVDRIANYSPDIVTFGGGDPFAHNEFLDLLHYCQQYSFQVHVDTNTIKMPLDRMEEIRELVDVIGVPLDGDRQQHDTLRNYSGHFDIVDRSLNALQINNIPAKINTVYFPECENQLHNIAQKLGAYSNIKQWFIYEYWHFSGINVQKTSSDNGIPFFEKHLELQRLSNIVDIHYSTVVERSPAYLFVSSLGNLYTIGNDMCSYIELGNIFDSQADEILLALQNVEQIQSRTQIKLVVPSNAK